MKGVKGERFDVLGVALMKRHDAVEVDKHLSMLTTFIPTAAQKRYNAL